MELVTFNAQRGSGIPVYSRPRNNQAAANPFSARGVEQTAQIAHKTDRLELSKNSNKEACKFGTRGEAAGSSSANGARHESRNRRMARMESQNIRVRNGRQLPVYFVPREIHNDLKSLSRKDMKKALEGVNFMPKLDFLVDECDHIEIVKEGGKVRGYLYDQDDNIILNIYDPITNVSKEYKPITNVLADIRGKIKEENRAMLAHAEGRDYEPSFESKFNAALDDFWEMSLTGKTYRYFKNN